MALTLPFPVHPHSQNAQTRAKAPSARGTRGSAKPVCKSEPGTVNPTGRHTNQLNCVWDLTEWAKNVLGCMDTWDSTLWGLGHSRDRGECVILKKPNQIVLVVLALCDNVVVFFSSGGGSKGSCKEDS